jgi:hypothetical protein
LVQIELALFYPYGKFEATVSSCACGRALSKAWSMEERWKYYGSLVSLAFNFVRESMDEEIKVMDSLWVSLSQLH